MQPDMRSVRQVAARTGLGLKFVAKDIALSAALKGLEGLLDDSFVLKGGTAIARGGYLDSPRFSEDIDLDVYTDAGPRQLGSETARLLSALEPFEISRPSYQRRGLRIDAHFDNLFGERDRLRVELSPRPRGGPAEVDAGRSLLQSPFTQGEACLLGCYTRGALFARKLHALSGRVDGKDPFDLRGLWRGGMNPSEGVAALGRYATVEGLDARGILTKAGANLGRMAGDIRMVATSADHFIPRSGRPDWGALLEDVGTIVKRISEGL